LTTELNIQDYIKHKAAMVEQELAKSWPLQWNIPDQLKESVMYSLMAGGKRIRPILVLSAAEAVHEAVDSYSNDTVVQAAMPVACAIEMIHTYSLIHDDLPGMDNDDFRRGKLTNHKVYGEAMAILAGDALLTHAFYYIIQSSRQWGVSAERVLSIVEELSKYAGAAGMAGGQAADIAGKQGFTSLQELQYVHIHKTSDLMIFSLRAGGHIAGATENHLLALEQFGEKLGLAFQIQDDILDITGDEQKLGKPLKSDERQFKVTYPYFIGLDASMEEVKRLTEEAKTALVQGVPNPGRLLQIADYLMNRDR
jgi:geranylgeranyl diphosphate synthase type II